MSRPGVPRRFQQPFDLPVVERGNDRRRHDRRRHTRVRQLLHRFEPALRCPGPRLDCYRHLAETHLFYLSFENTLCDDYITEKFWLALQAGMVPVVRGPSPQSYHRVAPPNSFIHVEDFAGPKALAAHLLAHRLWGSDYYT